MREGGEVYRHLFLLYRYIPEENDDSIPRPPAEKKMIELRNKAREGEKRFRAKQIAVDDWAKPRLHTYIRLQECVRYLNEWENYEHNFPYAGGLWEQPAMWKMALDCAQAARARAKREKELLEQANRPQQSA